MKRSSNRSPSMRRRISVGYFLVPGILLLIACAVILGLYMTGFFYTKKDIKSGADMAGKEIEALSGSAKISPSDMLARISSLLSDQTRTSPYLTSWYALPGAIKSVEALQSEYIAADDQALLLRYYVKKGDRASAKTLADAIADDFTAENGFLVPAKKIPIINSLKSMQTVFPGKAGYEELPAAADFSAEATAQYLRALLEYYQKWGGSADWTRIEKLAALLYTDANTFQQDMTVTVTTPPPAPAGVTPEMSAPDNSKESTGGSFTAVSLCALDPEVLRMLGTADSKYQPMYQKALNILSQAMISETLPLFALGYSQNPAGYVYVDSDTNEVMLIPSLKVTLYLAQAGKAPKQTILWLKGEMYNQGMLYQSYDLISGQNVSDTESVEAYGILLQIARAVNDADLYGKALDLLQRHLATSSTSQAKNAVFRQVDSTRVAVYAKDNLEALLGL